MQRLTKREKVREREGGMSFFVGVGFVYVRINIQNCNFIFKNVFIKKMIRIFFFYSFLPFFFA
uniref:Uncharacterized protein n=1 Tax=Octopus bimaculoides TaxID=37653 RepID=A0A0L8FZT3_OCTBM